MRAHCETKHKPDEDAHQVHIRAWIARELAHDHEVHRHRITIEYRALMPDGVGGYANWRTRGVAVEPIVDEDRAAVAYHEIGHVLVGECPETSPHYRDPAVREWRHCVQCEADATRRAMTLCDFSKRMVQRLQRGCAPIGAVLQLTRARERIATRC